LITGGASGIGLAIARKLLAQGSTVALVDLGAERLQAAARQLSGDVLTFEADITSEESVNRAVGELLERRDRIDVVINSAGVTGLTNRKTADVPFADFQRVVAINLHGSFLISKAVLPGMVQRGFGRILLIASIAGKEGNAGMCSYSASKAAVIGLTKCLGKEYAETGVTINAIAPAVIRTAMVEALPPEQVDYMTAKIPMRRCGTLDEIAHAAAFIVSRENSFTTGFCYDLSGGRAVY
jgi:3-oxoacyl-[acyl-carrier protein] reductase